MSLKAISKELQLRRNTVRRHLRATSAEELLTQTPRRGSQLDPYTGYLAMRWQEDCTNAVELAREIRRARTIWQYWHVPALSGLLPPSPAPPGSGCSQLLPGRCDDPTAKVSHLHSNHSHGARSP
jgi:hypothetical protein